MASSINSRSSQDFVPIKEIRDGIVVLNDGTMLAVLMASSLNFGLKSAGEQDSILYQFQNFLNTLDFGVQFYIQSRELDIRPYIALLQEQYQKQVNELLKIQTLEYMKFIQSFMENNNVMNKSFFIVVNYVAPIIGKNDSAEKGIKGLISSVTGTSGSNSQKISDEAFDESKVQLLQRLNVVEQGLSRTGVRVIQLNNEELTELYYNIFNLSDLTSEIKTEQ